MTPQNINDTEDSVKTRNSEGAHDPGAAQDRHFLQHALRLAREAQELGSSPVGAVLVDAGGKVIAEGQNRTGEKFGPERVGGMALAHAEMDAFFRAGKLEDPENLTLYTSLEPCLMCGGGSALLQIGRVVWATEDAWGGSGRLIAWDEHPAMKDTRVTPTPFADLEHEGALLFAPEAKKAFPAEGWAMWQARYPQETAGLEGVKGKEE
ncbi:nucleoside deaminase [Deinococcus altitudinis]|uniref:nucleoside deaminase n=1 Tax=Deinococcus altitudinis TaxID=468914 RepID=UPI0038923745